MCAHRMAPLQRQLGLLYNGSHCNRLQVCVCVFVCVHVCVKHLYFEDFRNYSIPSPESSCGGRWLETLFLHPVTLAAA